MMRLEDIFDISYLAKGKRGIVYKGRYRGRDVIIKKANPGSKAIGRIGIEADWLEKLNRHGIGPKLFGSGDGYLIEEFIAGPMMMDYLKEASRSEIKRILKDILEQCFILDSLKANKEEMHRPLKNMLMRGKSPVMIDFERARITLRPKNVTQFCQFIMFTLESLLAEKGMSIDKDRFSLAVKAYSKDNSRKNLDNILALL